MYSEQKQPPSSQQPPAAQRVQFEDIGTALQLLQKQLGAWVGAGAITVFGFAAAIIPFYVVILAALLRKGEALNPATLIGPGILLVVGALFFSALTMSGMYQMALKQLRGGTLSARDLFSSRGKIGQVLGLLLILGLIGGLLGGLMQAIFGGLLGPFVGLVSSIPSSILGALSSLATLLILDQNLSPVAALQESWRVLKSELWIAVAFVLLASLASTIGGMACGIGMIVTLPMYYLCVTLLYRNFYPERFPAREPKTGGES